MVYGDACHQPVVWFASLCGRDCQYRHIYLPIYWEALPPIDAMKSANSEVIFQQDVSQCHHTTLKVKAWFASNDISLLVLRSSSPDFSPIETFMERDEKKN